MSTINTSDVEQGCLQLRLQLPYSWDCIESVRQAVAAAIMASLSNPMLAEQMAMVASELLENAVKHGEEGPIALTVQETAGQLEVALSNAVGPDPVSTVMLADRIAFIHRCASAREAYLTAMLAVYEQGLASASSSQSTLGLARIAAEGECLLEMEQSRPGWVTVRARRAVPVEQPEEEESP